MLPLTSEGGTPRVLNDDIMEEAGEETLRQSSAIVVTEKRNELLPTRSPILEFVTSELVVVAWNFYYVYSLHETQPLSSVPCGRSRQKEGEKVNEKSPDPDTVSQEDCSLTSSLTSSPPPPSLPYDVKTFGSSSGQRRSDSSSRERIFQENHYLPEKLCLDDVPERLRPGSEPPCPPDLLPTSDGTDGRRRLYPLEGAVRPQDHS